MSDEFSPVAGNDDSDENDSGERLEQIHQLSSSIEWISESVR